MKFTSLLFILLAFPLLLMAQAPVNDNCTGLIDLGIAPACPQTVFTNVNATATNIGLGNNPSCFNGGTAQRDVWFAFTVNDTMVDLTISVSGSTTGPNGQAITNPQIALYRGDCQVNGLDELLCISSPNGSNQTVLDVLGLSPGTTYYLRINDYSATAAPNSGDFTVCVSEYVPAINIGDSPGSSACFGTLYDSGGPTGTYQNNENHTFTICPADFHQCIELSVNSFNMENNLDRLNVYNGNSITAPLIGTITGINPVPNPFVIEAATAGCVTVQFISDGSVTGPGFELTWSCSPLACTGTSFDNPIVINTLPFNQTGLSTCDDASNINQSPCGNDAFLNGPEVVYQYTSPGGICVGIQVTGANTGTGVLVLNGPPGDPNTVCIASSPTGTINSADLRTAGVYYIVVADGNGCTPYNINIAPTECELPAGLVNALCNPLNGCIDDGGVPSVFNFQDGFQDMDLIAGVNSGCFPTNGVGAQADFYWFTIQAQADGPFGFVLAGAGTPSDIDFNVWGPFTQAQVCETPSVVISAITNTQPIRSSWTGGSQSTGLADIHPVTGIPVLDDYDCGSPATPGAGGDRFVRTIPALEGQVFVVLTNDFGNQIGTEGISVDWGPSAPDVLAPLPPQITGGDTTICIGESVQLGIVSAIGNITWTDPDGTLSCTACPNPVATPTSTTTYIALLDAVCYDEVIPVKVVVFDVDAGPDLTICRGEQIQISAGEPYENAVYEWIAPPGVQLSCDDCPEPMVTGLTAGNLSITVRLITPNCTLEDHMTLEVLPQEAPQFAISENTEICVGASVNLGGAATPGVVYSWSSVPGGFASGESNPSVAPSQSTTYYLSATNSDCPLSSLDSVTINVYQQPDIAVASDTAVCQGSSIILGLSSQENDVIYLWTGPDNITDSSNPNTTASPQSAGTYVLTATRGVCVVSDSLSVTITPIDISINNPDTVTICQGDVVNISLNITPSNAEASWSPFPGLSSTTGNTIQASPMTSTTYQATVSVPGCIKTDLITIQVDSLPFDRQLSALPVKDPYCPGETVILTSPVFEPTDFPDLSFRWLAGPGFETADTLWNMVITTNDTFLYQRVLINRGCIDTVTINLNVVDPPDVVLTPSQTTICAGDSVQLNASDYEDYPFTWEPTTGLSCTDCPNPIATPTETTTYTFRVDVPNCPVGASSSITVVTPPVTNPAPNQTICLGATVQLNRNADDESIYVWTSSTDPGFTSTDPFLVVSPLETTTFTLTATKFDCAPVVRTIILTVIQPPTANAGPDQTICEGSAATLNGIVGGSALNGTWTTIAGGSFTPNSTTLNASFTPSAGPSVTLTLSATDPAGVCPPATDQMTITVAPRAIVSAGADRTICAGDTLRLQGDIGGAATSAVWSASVPGGSFSPNASVTTAIYTPPAGFTSVTLTLMTNDPTGPCPAATDDMVITITPRATINLGQDFTVCRNVTTAQLEALVSPSGVNGTYRWSLVGSSAVLGTSSTLDVNPSTLSGSGASYVVGFTYGPNGLCGTVFDTLRLNVIDSIPISLTADTTTVLIGTPVNITVVSSPSPLPGARYFWSVDGGTEVPGNELFTDSPAPNLSPGVNSTTVRYMVRVVSAEGCESIQFIDITVIRPEIAFPNVFTPNGDELNDVFRPIPAALLDVLEFTEFKVFNRWGQVVYDGKSNNNRGWDGTQNGKLAPSDVYVYKILVRFPGNPIIEASGDITLMR
jgi:gliding motility-associated-like protein